MRLIKTIIPVLLVVIFTASCVSTTRTRVRPRKHIVITKLNNPYTVKHNNVTYYHSNGRWYKKRNRSYTITTPPNGLIIKKLPNGYKTVTIRKQRYYTHNGVYYKKEVLIT